MSECVRARARLPLRLIWRNQGGEEHSVRANAGPMLERGGMSRARWSQLMLDEVR